MANALVSKLPEPNFDLLVALFGFLVKVVDNADVNKMNVNNCKSMLPVHCLDVKQADRYL